MTISDRDLIATVHNRFGNRTISRFDYTNDEIGRRIARVDSGEAFSETAFERYSYNDRSEVIGSQRFYGADINDLSRPVTGRTFGYGYDPIGNRVSSFEDAGGQRLTTTYTANELNQYTAIQNAAAVPLRGDAERDAVVTVNGDRAERDNGTASFTPWSYSLPSDDTTAHYQNANVLAVAQNAVGEDVEQRESGSVFVPATETLPTYDDDGNMTFDGRFRYSWNGENRMIRAEEAVVPSNRAPTVITYAYDEQGRMGSKKIAGTNVLARSLLWDGYNIVRETDNGVATYNIWGLDLDGTLQGCSGVGGLIAVAKSNGSYFAFYDSNGNISEYVSYHGNIVSHFDFLSFGQFIVQTNYETFTHIFSTKPYCPSTSLMEFQLRQYHSSLGRWVSRDKSENNDINLFSYCDNSYANVFDILGLVVDWRLKISLHVASTSDPNWPKSSTPSETVIAYTTPEILNRSWERVIAKALLCRQLKNLKSIGRVTIVIPKETNQDDPMPGNPARSVFDHEHAHADVYKWQLDTFDSFASDFMNVSYSVRTIGRVEAYLDALWKYLDALAAQKQAIIDATDYAKGSAAQVAKHAEAFDDTKVNNAKKELEEKLRNLPSPL